MKKYNFTWYETIKHSLDVEAENKKEVEEKFYAGEYNLLDAEQQDGQMEEGSLEISEVEK